MIRLHCVVALLALLPPILRAQKPLRVEYYTARSHEMKPHRRTIPMQGVRPGFNQLLDLGANVNARNNDGETPIFTTVDVNAIPVFVAHGADLLIRKKDGKTVLEATSSLPKLEALRKAMAERGR